MKEVGDQGEIGGEAGKGGVFLGRGNENLQRGKAVTRLSFTFPYRMLSILITHSRFSSNTAFFPWQLIVSPQKEKSLFTEALWHFRYMHADIFTGNYSLSDFILTNLFVWIWMVIFNCCYAALHFRCISLSFFNH